jgi:hypothetical protein
MDVELELKVDAHREPLRYPDETLDMANGWDHPVAGIIVTAKASVSTEEDTGKAEKETTVNVQTLPDLSKPQGISDGLDLIESGIQAVYGKINDLYNEGKMTWGDYQKKLNRIHNIVGEENATEYPGVKGPHADIEF